jgi:hypothetical protein
MSGGITLSVSLYKENKEKQLLLEEGHYNLELFGWFKQNFAKQLMVAVSLETFKRIPKGEKCVFSHDIEPVSALSKIMLYAHKSPEGTGFVVITDDKYPEDLVNRIVLRSIERRDHTLLLKLFEKPEEDIMEKIKQDLGETKDTLKQSIGKLIQNGESLESVLLKSEAMSEQSKSFFVATKSMNGCCIIV